MLDRSTGTVSFMSPVAEDRILFSFLTMLFFLVKLLVSNIAFNILNICFMCSHTSCILIHENVLNCALNAFLKL